MKEQLDDYLAQNAERQGAMLRIALELNDKEASEQIVQHIILRQNITVGSDQQVGEEARDIMRAILLELRNVDKADLPERAIFSVGSVAYSYFDADVRKEAADLLVEWALPTPPPCCHDIATDIPASP